MNNKFKIVILSALAVVLIGCTATPNNTNRDSNDDSPSQGTSTGNNSSTDGTSSGGSTGSQTTADIDVRMSSFTYSPNVITATAGETLTVKLTVGDGMHDFVIDELNVKSNTLTPGGEQIIEIEVPASAAGKEFTFYCSVGNHRALGMEGTLKVN